MKPRRIVIVGTTPIMRGGRDVLADNGQAEPLRDGATRKEYRGDAVRHLGRAARERRALLHAGFS